jgi:fucose permease
MLNQRAPNSNAMMIIGMLFFIFGFVTWLNGTLIPFLNCLPQLQNDIQAFFVTFAFYMAYFFPGASCFNDLKKNGFKMAWHWFIGYGNCSLIFIPAAESRNFALFLCGLFVQGAGLLCYKRHLIHISV